MITRLDKKFGGGAEARLQLQADFELELALKKAQQIKVERIDYPRVAQMVMYQVD